MAAPTLFIEFPATFGASFTRRHYSADIYDAHDRKLGAVEEKGTTKIFGAVRWLDDVNGETPFSLVLRTDTGEPVLHLRKGPSLFRNPRVAVSRPDGTEVGSLVRKRRGPVLLLDPEAREIGGFGTGPAYTRSAIAERDGKRVRRDVLHVDPAMPEPQRTLTVAAAAAYPVVIGFGTDVV